MIEIKGISKTYAKGGTMAVDSLDLSIPDGEIVGFLGPNGAGKTTTIKIVTGIVSPDGGTVTVDGIELAADPLSAKARMSYVPDNPELFPRLRASEYLSFIADVYGIPEEPRRERIERYARLLKIADVLDGKISSFSHGMMQKLVICGSLLPDPDNWILDEPLVGLDPEAAFILKDIMRERARAGKAVFFSTHVMEVAEKLCTRLAVISKGKVVFTGTIDELRAGADSSLEELFLQLVDSDLARKGRETETAK